MNNNIYNGQQAPYIPQPVPVKAKIKPEYSKAEKVLSVFVMIAAFCFVRYVLFHTMGFITTGLYIAIITAAVIYMKKRNCRFTRFNKVLTAVMYIFSLVFSVTSNDLIKNLDAMFLFGAGAYLVYSLGTGNESIERFLPFAMCKAVFQFPFSHFGTQASIASDSLSNSKTGSNAKKILAGLVLTVPLTVVVAALLMSADDGVERMLSGLFDKIFGDEIWEFIFQLSLALPCSLYLFGMFYSNAHCSELNRLSEQSCTQKLYNCRFISNLVMYTAVTPICILYVLFFISQGSYFLSAFMNDLPEGFTYADYARRGFFELFAVALINLGVLCAMSLHSKKAGMEKPFALKLYSVVLSIFTIILIATAISKMVMYIERYGLTELRFYTSWFMVLLGFIFILIIIKQFRYDMKFAKHAAVIFTLMFALLCFSRPESLIARYNIGMYNTGHLKELDKDTILRMSDDALLTAYNEGAITAEEANSRRSSSSERLTYGRYNIPSLILDSIT